MDFYCPEMGFSTASLARVLSLDVVFPTLDTRVRVDVSDASIRTFDLPDLTADLGTLSEC